MELRAYAVAVLAAGGILWAMSGTQKEKPVVSAAEPAGLRTLEMQAALHRADPDAQRALAQAYLDARQPGLAIVLVESASPPVRTDVRVEHVYARALVDAGRNEEALTAENRVVAACGPALEGRTVAPGCDTVLLASALRRRDILGQLVALGVEDAQAHPEVSLVAYQNATREARVALQ